jgi:hypothetical protein
MRIELNPWKILVKNTKKRLIKGLKRDEEGI